WVVSRRLNVMSEKSCILHYSIIDLLSPRPPRASSSLTPFCYNYEMVEIVNYTNEARETKFIATIESAYSAARELRPNLPQDIKIHFTDKGVVPGMFTGGYAH